MATKSRSHSRKAQGKRTVWIRPFLSEVLGLKPRAISNKFGLMGKIQPEKVKKFIIDHGYTLKNED